MDELIEKILKEMDLFLEVTKKYPSEVYINNNIKANTIILGKSSYTFEYYETVRGVPVTYTTKLPNNRLVLIR